MSLNKLSDNIVFKFLKYIKHGNLKLINYDGQVHNFGNINEKLQAELTNNT